MTPLSLFLTAISIIQDIGGISQDIIYTTFIVIFMYTRYCGAKKDGILSIFSAIMEFFENLKI